MAAEIILESIAIDGRFKHLHTYYIIDADVADALRRDGHAALGRVGIDSRYSTVTKLASMPFAVSILTR